MNFEDQPSLSTRPLSRISQRYLHPEDELVGELTIVEHLKAGNEL
jgi:hypothetical protein